MSEFFHRKITKDQSRDTGMAMVLLFMLLSISPRHHRLLFVAMALHVLNMTVPLIYRPVAVLWLGLSDMVGAVMSKVLLSIVFFLVVTPIAVLRRLFGKDALQLRTFKAGKNSVMRERNHTFTARDLESPY
jgi:Saxitoxin biosynthesis operon protein SxtJ